jgi:hypothetical protein
MFDEFGDPIATSGDAGLDIGSYDDSGGTMQDTFGSSSDTMNLGGLIPTGFSLPRIAGGLMGNPGRLAGRAGGAIMTAAGRFPVAKAWAAVKRFGPELVAGAVGMSAVDLISILISSKAWQGKRRRRGISSRDIRTTKRVCRFAHSLNASLAHCGTRHRRAKA